MIKKKVLSLAAGFVVMLQLSAAQVPAYLLKVPSDLKATKFSDKVQTPCPACLTVSADGKLFVGVDQNGSLGHKPNAGRIIRLIDTDGDGKADESTLFANVANPRGLIWSNNKLYVLHPPHLSVYTDADEDGKADGEPTRLVSNISVPTHVNEVGADHTTNGIRMGIDGWIYIAVGDFGYSKAKTIKGQEATMLGGGVVRIRPDGSDLEVYVHGLRNIYDVAIDPYMNMFTRGNTNDGGGWNVRFIHEIQSAEYGYPILFKRYSDEILPALVDVGGGSGTGAYFLSEPTWPAKYNNQPMMADWGRSQIFIHSVKPDGASFKQKQQEFIMLKQVTDLDVDGSGRMYAGSWYGNGYTGGNNGFVAQITPKDLKVVAFPNLKKMATAAVINNLRSDSAVMRLNASQELLVRKDFIADSLAMIASDAKASLASRVAAIFTLTQKYGAQQHATLVRLAEDASVREWALRALADHKGQNDGLKAAVFAKYLQDPNPRVQVAAAVALGRLTMDKKAAAEALIAQVPMNNPALFDRGLKKFEVLNKIKPIYSSKLVSAKQSQFIDIALTSRNLYLVAQGGKGGNGGDHAAWFEPTLIFKNGNKLKLTELKWKKATQGWGKTLVNKSCTGQALKRQDGKSAAFGIGTHADSVIYYKLPKNVVRFQATVAISDSSDAGSVLFKVFNQTPSHAEVHATPNSSIISSHVAVKALVALNAVDECLTAANGDNSDLAFWAMSYMHDKKLTDALIANYPKTDVLRKKRILRTLVRLYNREKFYDGSWWWKTRPDTRGPYYKMETWEGSASIKTFLKALPAASAEYAAQLMKKDRVVLDVKAGADKVSETKSNLDFAKVYGKQGAIASMGLEEIVVAMNKVKGNVKDGAKLFKQQGCTSCHSMEPGDALKGPHLAQVGAILDREGLTMAILRPNQNISQGFPTFSVSTKDGKTYIGFISKEDTDKTVLIDSSGKSTTIPASKITGKKQMHGVSSMPPALVNALSVEEFASLLTYLQSKKK